MAQSLLFTSASKLTNGDPVLLFTSPEPRTGDFMIKKLLKDFLTDEEGQSVIEYSLLMMLIGTSTVLLLTLMGVSISEALGTTDITVERYAEWAVNKYRSK